MKHHTTREYEADLDGILEPKNYRYQTPYQSTTQIRGGVLREGQLRPGAAPVYTSREVLGLFAQYVTVGLLYGMLPNLSYPVFINYFHLTGAQVNSATTLITMGWNFKVFVGMLSDCVPIWGYRRKSWMMVGWLLCFVCMIVLALRPHGDPYYDKLERRPSEMTPSELDKTSRNISAPSNGTFIALISGLASMCYIVSDVAADALLVEIAQREPESTRGRLQSLAYMSRTIASVFSQTLLGVCLNSKSYGGTFSWDIGLNAIFWILSVPCIIMVPLSFMFIRETGRDTVNIFEYFNQCWQFLQNRAVLQVMVFLFLFNLATSLRSTAQPYIQAHWAKADNMNSQFSSIATNLIFAAGIAFTGQYGTSWNWKSTVILCLMSSTVMNGVVQFLTIFGVIRSQWFYLYAPLLESIPGSVMFIVVSFVNVELAEVGNEGITYALLTTISNLPPALGSVISNIICSQFDVLEADIVSDTSIIQWQVAYTYFIQYGTNVIACVVAILFLPSQKYHVYHLKTSTARHPYLAATITTLAFAALVFAISASILSMFESTMCYVVAGGSGCP